MYLQKFKILFPNFMGKRKYTLCKFISEIIYSKKKYFLWKNPSKNTRIWDVRFLLSYLPPLSYFVRFCLTPPTPPKIGHHLCMFPNGGKWKLMSYLQQVSSHLPLLGGVGASDMIDIGQLENSKLEQFLGILKESNVKVFFRVHA